MDADGERHALARIHENPESWLGSMGVRNRERVAAVAHGCAMLLERGLTPRQIRRAIQESPCVLDAMSGGDYTTALVLSEQLLSKPRRDAIDPDSGEWVELPDDTPIVDVAGRRIGTVGSGMSSDVSLVPSAEEQLRGLQQDIETRKESSALIRMAALATGGTIIAV